MKWSDHVTRNKEIRNFGFFFWGGGRLKRDYVEAIRTDLRAHVRKM